MAIVYASPYLPNTPTAPLWSGIPMSWTAKGVEWPLTDWSTGIILMNGVRGLGTTAATRHTTTSPGQPGARYQGLSTLEREVNWPVHIWHDAGSVEWMLRDRAFWAGMDPEDTGVWTITHPDGAKRSLRLRFTSDNNHTRALDPTLVGWDSYSITLVAEQPFWEGSPVVRAWKNDTALTFFELTGPNMFNIASGAGVSTATLDNPGDVESYPRWFIDGATTAASVGVGSTIVNIPFAIAAGKCLVIESEPDSIGATLYDIAGSGTDKKPSQRIIGTDLTNPVDKTAQLGEADFGAIPAGQSVPLSLTLAGSGVVEAYLPTLYRRPW